MYTSLIVFRMLTFPQKTALIVLTLYRVLLNTLDLVGIALIGSSVMVLTQGVVSRESITGRFISYLSFLGFQNSYAAIAAVAVSFFLLKTLLALQLNSFVAKFGTKIEVQLSNSLYLNFIMQDAKIEKSWTEKELVHALTASSSAAFSQSLLIVSVIAGEGALILGTAIFLVAVDYQLFLISGTFLGFFMLALNFFSNTQVKRNSQRVTNSFIRLSQTTSDTYHLRHQIRLLGKASSFVSFFDKDRNEHAKSKARILFLGYLPRYVTEAVLMLGLGVLMLQRSVDGGAEISAQTLGIFLAGIFRLIASALSLLGSLSNLKSIEVESKAALELWRDLSSNSEVKKAKNPNPHLLLVENLQFSHENSSKPLFDSLNFSATRGQILSITGKSGQGKSTVIKLLSGALSPSSGKIYVMGLDPVAYISKHPGKIGYVPQDIYIMNGTIAENILLEKNPTDFNLRAMTKLLDQVGLLDFVKDLPNGVQTVLGQQGVELSGGQIKRLGLCRALVKSPVLLLVDEITSSLDVNSKKSIRSLLLEIKKTTCVIQISHDEDDLKLADVVIEV